MNDLNDRVKQVMSEILGCDIDSINPSTTMELLPEWDSLQHLSLVIALEQTFSVRFTTDEVTTMQSFNEIVDVIEKRV